MQAKLVKMDRPLKILYFEYILHGLLQWYREEAGQNEHNDLSVLKSLKLLFFVAAAKAKSSAPSPLLDDVFDDFVAMPYGHVESEIYDHIREKNGVLTYYIIDSRKTSAKGLASVADVAFDKEVLNVGICEQIDESIKYLKYINPHLIMMAPFDLVNLSHAWYSWQRYYDSGLKYGMKSSKIPVEAIKSEDKLFRLQLF